MLMEGGVGGAMAHRSLDCHSSIIIERHCSNMGMGALKRGLAFAATRAELKGMLSCWSTPRFHSIYHMGKNSNLSSKKKNSYQREEFLHALCSSIPSTIRYVQGGSIEGKQCSLKCKYKYSCLCLFLKCMLRLFSDKCKCM